MRIFTLLFSRRSGYFNKQQPSSKLDLFFGLLANSSVHVPFSAFCLAGTRHLLRTTILEAALVRNMWNTLRNIRGTTFHLKLSSALIGFLAACSGRQGSGGTGGVAL